MKKPSEAGNVKLLYRIYKVCHIAALPSLFFTLQLLIDFLYWRVEAEGHQQLRKQYHLHGCVLEADHIA